MDQFLEFAAGLFECDTAELTPETAYGQYEKWDSMMMLRLILEVEEEYKVNIPIENVAKIKTLADIYQYVEGAI